MYDFLIVGSGLFGSVFAHEATKAGKSCLVVEKRDHMGGNCYTEEVSGINVHKYGAHIFHTSHKETWDYIRQFCEMNHYVNSPVANYHGEIYDLPFNMNTFSRMWGISTPQQAQEIIEKQRLEIKTEPCNLEEQAISLVGRDIYLKLIKDYTEKQWGRACSELPASIIRRLPVRFTYDNNYYDDAFQGIPTGGYTPVFEKMLEGSDVVLGVDYLRERESFDSKARIIIYTGTIDSYYDYCFGALEYRSLRFETELLEIDNYQGVAVMNYCDAQTPYTRIIEHKHFEFGKQPVTVISKEFSSEWNVSQEPYYPLNDEKNQQLCRKYQALAGREKHVLFGGRLGEYKYYDMKDIIPAARKLAAGVL